MRKCKYSCSIKKEESNDHRSDLYIHTTLVLLARSSN